MRITKGLITAAGEPQRRLPLQTLVDRDGVTRTVLSMLVNEMIDAGIEQVCIVVPPGAETEYAHATDGFGNSLHFVPQSGTPGYAQAILCGRNFLGEEPFLHLVSDHIYVRGAEGNLAKRLVAIASAEGSSVSAVQATHESAIGRFGVVGGRPLLDIHAAYLVDTVIEKPTPTVAEESLVVSGLRSGYYLAFFGMHVLMPDFLGILERQARDGGRGGTVSEALAELARETRYLALQSNGQRYDLGPQYGLLKAQLALTLSGKDREELLASMVELLAVHGAASGETGGRE